MLFRSFDNVTEYPCTKPQNQLWLFEAVGNGYQIRTQGNKCLNVKGNTNRGNQLIIYTCTPRGAANDVWLPTWRIPAVG